MYLCIECILGTGKLLQRYVTLSMYGMFVEKIRSFSPASPVFFPQADGEVVDTAVELENNWPEGRLTLMKLHAYNITNREHDIHTSHMLEDLYIHSRRLVSALCRGMSLHFLVTTVTRSEIEHFQRFALDLVVETQTIS